MPQTSSSRCIMSYSFQSRRTRTIHILIAPFIDKPMVHTKYFTMHIESDQIIVFASVREDNRRACKLFMHVELLEQ